ncbi:hypothetical protein [Flavicella sediminum]|uniref:hypothetical protein n=1 Tax=Flavicella sediminum TaxID=2585141 RepID=UPI001121AD53|nr:hypothetical protein [Flavicella sediminum]
MFEELEKYENSGHFFYEKNDNLREICNAPKSGIGIYLIYALKNGKIELVYTGCTGKITQDGMLKTRKGGIYDTLVNGKQFGELRTRAWDKHIIIEDIEALDVYWYETFDQYNMDIPAMIEGKIIQQFFEIHGKLPNWNKEY